MSKSRPETKERKWLDVTLIHPNAWNPNTQSEETFNQLTEEIKEDGFDHPINVCPCDCDLIEDPHYVIIGGKHRWKVCKVHGYEEIEATIYTDWDETTQKLKTVRRNLLTGELDTKKFTALVKSLEETIDINQMPELFGFDSEREFQKYVIEEKTKAESSFFDSLIEESKKEKFAVDSISDIISNIFSITAETIDQDYLFFTYKGATTIIILCDEDLAKLIKNIHERLKDSGDTATDLMKKAIDDYIRRIPLTT